MSEPGPTIRYRFAAWLCEPLVEKIHYLEGRIDGLEKSLGLSEKSLIEGQKLLSSITSELNDLRNYVADKPEPPPPQRIRRAGSWNEFEQAAILSQARKVNRNA